MKEFNFVSVVFGVVGGFMANMLGGYDKLLETLLVLAIADYVSGVIKAIIEKKVSSEIGFNGIMKKILMFGVVVATVALERLLGTESSQLVPLREMAIMFYISNEGLSFFENASAFIPMPERIKNIFLNLRESEDDRK